jgi:4-methylaminobutanoate oxidase (formaldehyde-forming)
MPNPTQAEIVIIGGGIIGCSIAYHLTRMGHRDVLILEKSGVTHGATWHAAGLVGQLRTSRNVHMLQRGVELYDKLEQETRRPSVEEGGKPAAGLLAGAAAGGEARRHQARASGWRWRSSAPRRPRRCSPDEHRACWPAAFLPSDGYVDPARRGPGAGRVPAWKGKIIRGSGHGHRGRGTARRAGTDRAGRFHCEIQSSRGHVGPQIGQMAGMRVPSLAIEHRYLVTDPIPDMPKNMPTLRDHDLLVYYKPEVRGIAVGGYEPDTVAFAPRGIPREFARELLPGNFDRFEQLAVLAAKRTPILEKVGVRQLINGPIPYSADSDFIMGKSPELDNCYVAAGFLYGIAAGGGAGRMMAEWIVEGAPSLDLWPLDVRRFAFHHNTGPCIPTPSAYGHHYKITIPGWSMRARAASGAARVSFAEGEGRGLAQGGMGAAELVRPAGRAGGWPSFRRPLVRAGGGGT